MNCAREGCTKQGVAGDAFCSTYCAKIHYGTLELAKPLAVSEKRKHRNVRQNGPDYIDAPNRDAMTRRVPGSYGTGKTR